MATIQIVLRRQVRENGSYPLAIRIIKNRKPTFIHIGQNVLESDWDPVKQRVKKSHPNANYLNKYIQKKLADATDKVLEFEIQKSEISSRAIKIGLNQSAKDTFFRQATIYIDHLKKAGKYNRISAEQPRINRFKEFLNGEDILFQDITVTLLNKYQAYLKGSRNIGNRTVVNHLIIIRSIFSQAIKGEIVDPKYYPFGKNKIRIKFPESVKIGLTIEEVKRLEELKLELGSHANHARNIWLLSFYFAGMRVSDLLRLKWTDFQDDRLYYSMGKNEKAGSFMMSEKAVKILSQYEHRKTENTIFVFPVLDSLTKIDDLYNTQRKISYAVKSLNEALQKIAPVAKIRKKLTMHIARHTFGNISGDKIPIQMLQKLYRHTSITTTIAYQANFINKDTDEALDSVINF
ncbi:MAG: site-specific integrase [Saprospiraceae bacterium]|jgi:integrase/recombinase XerD|nr:site-specific integrase [Saprospiraceae bacterium]